MPLTQLAHRGAKRLLWTFHRYPLRIEMEKLSLAASWPMDKAFIDGKWIGSPDGKVYGVNNPSTGELICNVPDLGAHEATSAINAAHNAFTKWQHTTAKERHTLLRRLFDLMVSNKSDLAKILTAENGKPIAESNGEVMYAANFVEWFAEECRRNYGDIIPSPAASKELLVFKQPIGVAAMITPWNFPSAMITRKAAAAIAAGCTVVLKPAEDTPLSALALCKLFEEAGFPPGVFNVVTTSRAGSPPVGKAMCESPLVAALSFTGSTATGKILLKQCADTVKKVSLELGGNAPFIVFNSADLDAAVQGLMICKFRGSGQTCVCANRILVQDEVYDEFVKKLGAAVEKLQCGDGFKETTTQGPMINLKAVEKVESLVQSAVGEGAKVVLGGKRSSAGDLFYEPTLLVDVYSNMKVVQEEQFGPVAACIRFNTEDEAVQIANATRSGLAGYFYSQDISQIFRVSKKLEYGMVGVNEGLISAPEAPFGGYKESGLGREGSKYGLEDYTEIKYVCIGNLKK